MTSMQLSGKGPAPLPRACDHACAQRLRPASVIFLGCARRTVYGTSSCAVETDGVEARPLLRCSGLAWLQFRTSRNALVPSACGI